MLWFTLIGTFFNCFIYVLQPSIFNINKIFFYVVQSLSSKYIFKCLRILHNIFSLRFIHISEMFEMKHVKATFYQHFIIKIYVFLYHTEAFSTNVYTILRFFHFTLRGIFSICFINNCYCHLYLTWIKHFYMLFETRQVLICLKYNENYITYLENVFFKHFKNIYKTYCVFQSLSKCKFNILGMFYI